MTRWAVSSIMGLCCLTLGACSYAPSAETLASADYGSPMTASQMRSLADDYLVDVLKDPESRRVQWGQAGRVWVWTGLVGGGTKYGYGLEGDVNAKNSFGGYTGSKPYLFFFRDSVLNNVGQITQGGIYGFAA